MVLDGTILITLFYGVTFVIVLLQQNLATNQKMTKLATAPLGLGNVYAALGGAVTPFCSCSTVPVLSGMMQARIRFGFCFTFLMASPLVNEAVIIILWKYFGWQYLLSFVSLALLLPIVFGIIADSLRFDQFVRDYVYRKNDIPGEVKTSTNTGFAVPLKAKLKFAALMSKTETISVLPYLAVGLLIGGLIHGFVPDNWIINLSNQFSGPTMILLMAILGIPFYFNLMAVIPVAFALTDKGIGIGAVTAFLVAGAGTSLPELILLFKLFRTELLVIHVLFMWLAAVLMGFFFYFYF